MESDEKVIMNYGWLGTNLQETGSLFTNYYAAILQGTVVCFHKNIIKWDAKMLFLNCRKVNIYIAEKNK